jgi:hypothetical protein
VARDTTRRQMTALVRRWGTSGETQAVFAQQHGVSLAKFRYWQQRMDCEPASVEAVTFTPVQVVDSMGRAPGVIDVALTTGERVVVQAGASPDLVRAVLSALRAAC